MTQKKKFPDLFKQTEETVERNGGIDFEKSDIHHISAKKSTQVIKPKEKRVNRIQAYLTDSEFSEWSSTFAPLEKQSDRVRNLILEDTKKKKNQFKS